MVDDPLTSTSIVPVTVNVLVVLVSIAVGGIASAEKAPSAGCDAPNGPGSVLIFRCILASTDESEGAVSGGVEDEAKTLKVGRRLIERSQGCGDAQDRAPERSRRLKRLA